MLLPVSHPIKKGFMFITQETSYYVVRESISCLGEFLVCFNQSWSPKSFFFVHVDDDSDLTLFIS